jgi:hypothetical protein
MRRYLLPLGALVVLAGAGIGLAVWGLAGVNDLPGPIAQPADRAHVARPLQPVAAATDMPDPAAFPTVPHDDSPAERRRLVEVLVDLADRCGVRVVPDAASDPVALMQALDRDLRYRGPLLSDDERMRLNPAGDGAPDAGAALALRWDAAVRRFAADRPLPEPSLFRAGRLRWQLAVLAWSFHVDDAASGRDPRRSATEVALDLADALTINLPVRPMRLAQRYPALDSYAAFLGRLPRR